MLVGLIVVVVIFAVVFFTFRHALDGLPLLLMWGFIIGYQVVIWATVGLVYIQRKRETTRGYTSVPNVLPELPTVDYKTGRVLREAGDPPISAEEYELRRTAE